MKARQEFVDSSLEEAFRAIYLGFLTEDEMHEVIEGKDMWMSKPEVLSRFKGTYHAKAIAIDDPDAPVRRRGRPRKDS